MKNLLKFSFFTLFSGNLLFAAPIDFSKFDFNSGSPKIDVQSLNNEKTTENSTVTTKYSTFWVNYAIEWRIINYYLKR